MEDTKVCNTCKQELSIKLFYIQKFNKPKDGYIRNPHYKGKCKLCYSVYRKEMGYNKSRTKKSDQ